MKNTLSAFALAFALAAPASALAQSSPNLTFGQVPTAGQWNGYFAAKQDVLGYTPVNRAGDTMTGKLVTSATALSAAGLNLPHGTAPSSPVNGDLWTTTAGLYARINGSTVGPFTAAGAGSFAATSPLALTTPAGVVTYALNFNTSLAVGGGNLGINLAHANVYTAVQSTNLNATSAPSAQAGATAQLTQADGVTNRLELDAFANVARFTCVRADGTNAAPTTLQANDEICSLNSFGHNGTSVVGPNAAVRTYAAANWSATSNGTYVRIGTTATSDATHTLTDRLGVENDGGIVTFNNGTVATGGSQGNGTLNLFGSLYNNGTAPTGTGAYVRATSPALVTPALGVATATSINKVTITAPATGATLTIADGKTLTASNGGTLAGGDGFTLAIAAGKTLTVSNSVTFTGTDATSFALPNASDTLAGLGAAQTFTKQNIFGIASTVASGASATLDDVDVSAQTATISGNTHITTAKGFNKTSFYRPTYSAASALTVDQAATVYIENAPLGAGAGPATITNPLALWVGAGVSLFGGNVQIGGTPGSPAATPPLLVHATTNGNLWFRSIGANSAQIAVLNDAAGAFNLLNLDASQVLVNASSGGSMKIAGDLIYAAALGISATAPTIASGFCSTAPSITASNGTASFDINVGTSCSGSTGTLTMPAAANAWVCDFANVTTPASNVVGQTGGSTTTVTLTNYVRTTGVAGNFTASDHIRAKCTGY